MTISLQNKPPCNINFSDCTIPLVIDTRRPYLSGMPIISKVDISVSITSSMWLCLTFRYPCLEATSWCARLANQTFMFPPVEAGEVILISLNLAPTHRMRTKNGPPKVHQWGNRTSDFPGTAHLGDNTILVFGGIILILPSEYPSIQLD